MVICVLYVITGGFPYILFYSSFFSLFILLYSFFSLFLFCLYAGLLSGIQDSQPNRILLVTIHHLLYPITVEVLHQVFSPHGFVEKIVTFQKSAGQLLQVFSLSHSYLFELLSCWHLRSRITTMTTTAIIITIIFISMFLDGGSIACFLFLVNMVSSNYLLEVHVVKDIQCSL